jgi:hypothetical protein
MRLWTVHPKYLDAKGLVALWREALLAQKVLRGKTKGYRHHPQLIRFRAHVKPVAAVAAFLKEIHQESMRRGYKFDGSKIARVSVAVRLDETDGQLLYEWQHLRTKLQKRAPKVLAAHGTISAPDPHPIFRLVAGAVRDWEIRPASSMKLPGLKVSSHQHQILPRRKFSKSARSPSRAT